MHTLILLVLGCATTGGTPDTDSSDGIVSSSMSGTSADGLVQVPIDVANGQSALLIAGTTSTGRHLSIEDVLDPDGNVALTWEDWNGANTLTNSFYASYTDVAFNWPIREEDGALTPGTWTVEVATTNAAGDQYVDGIDIDVDVQVKNDVDLDGGVARVRVVYARGIGDDAAITDAVDTAIERWREIWATVGLDLEVVTATSDIDPALAYPSPDNAGLREASGGADGEQITLLVGETIGGSGDLYGYAGGIPGALLEGGRAGVEVSWLTCAGPDGNFSADDIELMAETLAHEVGHFQGLVHPVESGYNAWDALSDTPECSAAGPCENALGTNVMFPYSICNGGTCVDADQYTDEQGGVVNRYTGTL
jgi:hypothetical protein